jgi:hypothetical protein
MSRIRAGRSAEGRRNFVAHFVPRSQRSVGPTRTRLPDAHEPTTGLDEFMYCLLHVPLVSRCSGRTTRRRESSTMVECICGEQRAIIDMPLTIATDRSSTHRRVRCAPQEAWDVSESTAHVRVPCAADNRHRRRQMETADPVAASRRPAAALQRSAAGYARCPSHVLIQHLRQLERDGLVARTVVAEPHRQVDYRLTTFGATLRPALNEMAAWAKRHHRRFGATILPTP